MTEVKKAIAETPATPKPAESIGEFCVYIGPSIRGTIQTGTVYGISKDQAVAKLAPAIEKHPMIRELIVSGNELAGARIKVKSEGNLLNVYYKKLIADSKSV